MLPSMSVAYSTSSMDVQYKCTLSFRMYYSKGHCMLQLAVYFQLLHQVCLVLAMLLILLLLISVFLFFTAM